MGYEAVFFIMIESMKKWVLMAFLLGFSLFVLRGCS